MQKVVVTTVGTQTGEDGEECRIELVAAGTCHEKNGTSYIAYRENGLSGLEGTTTLLKVYGDYFVLVRRGTVEQRQEFKSGKWSDSTYVSPLGTMCLRVFTKRLEIAVRQGLGSLNVEYELSINGQWQSSNTLSVRIREDI